MKLNRFFNVVFNPWLISVFLLFIFISYIFYPVLGYDELLWAYVGRIWFDNGLPPYLYAVENKTPGNFILFAISEVFNAYNFVFARFLGALFALFSSVLMYKIAKDLHSKFAGLMAMLLFGLTFCWEILDGFSLAQTETFMVFFSVFSFFLINKAYYTSKFALTIFVAGFFLGLAISFKQIAITTLMALLIYQVLIHKKQNLTKSIIKGILFYVAGVLSAVLIMYFIVSFWGVSFRDYLDGAWLILLNPGSQPLDFVTRIINFENKFVWSRFVVFYPILLTLFFVKPLLKERYFKSLIVWLVIDFIGVCASGYFFGHQIKQLLPPLVLICSILLVEVIYKIGLNSLNHRRVLVLTTITVFFFPYIQFGWALKLFYEGEKQKPETLGIWLKQNTKEDDYIYILGGDTVLLNSLYYSDRQSSSKYYTCIFVQGKAQNEIIIKDLETNPPVFILKENSFSINENNYGYKVKHFLQNNYTLVKESEIYKVFKRIK